MVTIEQANGTSLSLADGVFHRLIQLMQLGIMTGTDVADHMRQVRLQPSADDPSVLELTSANEQAFKATLKQLDERMEQVMAQAAVGTNGDPDMIVPNRGSTLILAGG